MTRRQKRCYVCGLAHEPALQQHHALPQQYGGNDDLENQYLLCANCHQALERIYDDNFWQRVRETDFSAGSGDG